MKKYFVLLLCLGGAFLAHTWANYDSVVATQVSYNRDTCLLTIIHGLSAHHQVPLTYSVRGPVQVSIPFSGRTLEYSVGSCSQTCTNGPSAIGPVGVRSSADPAMYDYYKKNYGTGSINIIGQGAYSCPVNGTCSAGLNTCSTGSFSDVSDTIDYYRWSCIGSGGGSNASCTVIIPDKCLNIAGVQTAAPFGTTRNATGNCLCNNGANNPTSCNVCTAPKVWNPFTSQCTDRVCPQVVVCAIKNGAYAHYNTSCIAQDAGATIVAEKFCESCPDGQVRNAAGQCETIVCEAICDEDSICEANEGCSCSDCDGEQDNCNVGLLCEYNTNNPLLSSCQPSCVSPQVWDGTSCITPVNGQCGTSHNKTYGSEATGYGIFTQCSVGTPSLTSFPAPGNTVRWVCRGSSGGSQSAECSSSREQTLVPAAQCGAAAKTYVWDRTSFGADTLCETGISPNVAPTFPQPTQTISWVCAANGVGMTSTTCFASRGQQPICGSYDSRDMLGDKYPFTTQAFRAGSGYCAVGTTQTTPSFPASGTSVMWKCSTGNGPDAECTATRGVDTTNYCPAGTAYVSTSTKPATGSIPANCCTATEVAGDTYGCNNIVCNNNSVCDADEGCRCSDCTGEQDRCLDGLTCSGTAPSAACCPTNQIWDSTASTCKDSVTCPMTQTPDTIATGSIPYIGCLAEGKGTHFKYTLTGPSGFTYSSPIYALTDNSVRHTGSLTIEGSYAVRCFYGDSATQTVRGCSGADIDQTIIVGANEQTCTSVSIYKGATSLENYASQNAFTGSVICESDKPFTGGMPFSLKFGTNPWQDIAVNLESFIGITPLGFITSVSQSYDFTNGSTNVVCRVKSGNGYVTSDACQQTVCVGGACPSPKTLVLNDGKNPTCTSSPTSEYSIGCGAGSENPALCRKKFTDMFANTNALSQNITIAGTRNGAAHNFTVTCTRTSPTQALYEQLKCVTRLDSGQVLTLASGDLGGPSQETLTNTNILDRQTPTASLPSTNVIPRVGSNNLSSTTWSHNDLTVKIQCTDTPADSTGTCGCAGIKNTMDGAIDPSWSGPTGEGIFTRTFTEDDIYNMDLYVTDSAGNPGTQPLASPDDRNKAKVSMSFGIDKTPPEIAVTWKDADALGVHRNITLIATDETSGFLNEIKAKVVTLSAPNDFDSLGCMAQGGAIVNHANIINTKTLDKVFSQNNTTDKIIYCVSDAAGNIKTGIVNGRGQEIDTDGNIVVPTMAYSACFADGAMLPEISNLLTYQEPLKARIGLPQYGYSLSDSTRSQQNTLFLSRLNQNINTYIANQYAPIAFSATETNKTLDISTDIASTAKILGSSIPNTQGYYYYSSTHGGRVTLATSQSIQGAKVIYALGVDIYIDRDITMGANGSVIIIAKKFNNAGGNIYIKPTVKNVSATLIAEGFLLNGQLNTANTQVEIVTDKTQLLNKLTIQGKLRTYNNRGGSLKIVDGNLDPITIPNSSHCFVGNSTVNNSCANTIAAKQDLERFRWSTDTVTGASSSQQKQCTLYVTGTTPANVPILSGVVF